MKIENIYIDIDDVIINSSEIIIEYINEEYGTQKSFFDLKDWNYKSIYRDIEKDYITSLFESPNFFQNITINEEFKNIYKKTKEKVNWILFTQGTKKNLELKTDFFRKEFKDIPIITVTEKNSKKNIDLYNGIQIDDVYDNLKTNARIKILLKNDIETDYNQVKDFHEDLYICNTWKELSEMLMFFIDNPNI